MADARARHARVVVVGEGHRTAIARALSPTDETPFSVAWAPDADAAGTLRADCVVVAVTDPAAARAAVDAVGDKAPIVIVDGAGTEWPADAATAHPVHGLLCAEDLSPRLLRRTIVHAIGQQRMLRQKEARHHRLSDRRFRSMFESTLDAMLMADDARRFVGANPTACELLGMSAAEIGALRIDDVSSPRIVRELPGTWRRFLVDGSFSGEWTFVRPDGRHVDVELNATAQIAPGRHLAILRDVTARKRMDHELQRRLGQQAAVAALGGRALALPDLQCLMDDAAMALAEHLDVEYAAVLELQRDNEALLMRAGTGWREGVVGEAKVPATRESQAGYTLQAKRTVMVEDLHSEECFRGSALLWEHDVVSGLSVPLDGTGHPFGVLSVHSSRRRTFTKDDVCFMRSVANVLSAAVEFQRAQKLEDELHQHQRLESVGQLAGGIAHDFNNLLAVILNYAGFAIDELEDRPEVQADIEAVRRAAERGAQLTQQLLIFSRREVIKPELIDVNAAVSAADGLLRRTVEEHIKLRTSLDPSTLSTRAGVGQIEQVLVNLAINARDAMPDGGSLLIQTSNVTVVESDGHRPPLSPGGYVVISVTDTGSGMTREVVERAFEPFFTTKPRGAGTGLGLPTVYGIVTQAGGGLIIDSEPGRGTTVDVYLPAVTAGIAAKDVPEAAGSAPGRGEMVLVAEDEDGVRMLTERILTRNGYRVIAVEDGEAALAAFRREEIDLLVSDVVMPGMSGQELATRARELRPQLRMLFMSGYTGEAISRPRLVRAGVPLLQKPFDAGDLLEAVRLALSADGAPRFSVGGPGPVTGGEPASPSRP